MLRTDPADRKMPRTVQVAADREDRPDDLVTPNEVARSVFIERPPSAEALKVIHLLIKTAGGRIAEEVEHTIRLAEIRTTKGMRKHDRASLTPLLDELTRTVVSFDNQAKKRRIASGLLSDHTTDYRDEATGNVLVSWRFGRAFREIAELSCHWTILDKPTVLALRSRYALMLFQHIASLAELDHVTSKTFSVQDLRATLGVPTGRHKRFADLNKHALKQAIKEINRTSRLVLTATVNKIGRTVESVTIAWAEKPIDERREVKRELDRHSVGRKARQTGAVEQIVDMRREIPFPSSGSIKHANAGHWSTIAQRAGNKGDVTTLGDEFRAQCKRKSKPLDAPDIEDYFFNFARMKAV